jgi:TolB-like protein
VDLSRWKGDDTDRAWLGLVAGVRRFTGSEAAARAPAVTAPLRIGRNTRLLAGMAMAVLIMAAAGLWMFTRTDGESIATPAGASAPASRVTLAVLPFIDLSPAKEQEYFSDGLTEELLNQLAQIRGLRVTARTSSFSYKGRNEDVRVIGRELGVANLLEGSVRKDGGQLRITAQLISAADGSHLWSRTYDRAMSGVFALQEEVAKDVARALSVALDVGDLPRAEGGTTNIEAYDKYLQGRTLYHQGGPASARLAVPKLREAVTLDPQFARAWLQLSLALTDGTFGMSESEAAVWKTERNEATARVLELAPDARWSQSLRAFEFIGRRQWMQAEKALSAGAFPTAGFGFEVNGAAYTLLAALGRNRELVQVLQQAVEADPLSLTLSSNLQVALDAVGEPDKAQAEYERSLGLNGIHQRGHVYALLRALARKDAGAAEIRDRFRTLLAAESLRMPLIHSLAQVFEDRARSAAVIRQAMDDPANQDQVRMTVVALMADRYGLQDVALAALRKAYLEYGLLDAPWLNQVSGLRGDPRFKALVRESGLADFFRASGKWNDYCRPVGADDFECN